MWHIKYQVAVISSHPTIPPLKFKRQTHPQLNNIKTATLKTILKTRYHSELEKMLDFMERNDETKDNKAKHLLASVGAGLTAGLVAFYYDLLATGSRIDSLMYRLSFYKKQHQNRILSPFRHLKSRPIFNKI